MKRLLVTLFALVLLAMPQSAHADSDHDFIQSADYGTGRCYTDTCLYITVAFNSGYYGSDEYFVLSAYGDHRTWYEYDASRGFDDVGQEALDISIMRLNGDTSVEAYWGWLPQWYRDFLVQHANN